MRQVGGKRFSTKSPQPKPHGWVLPWAASTAKKKPGPHTWLAQTLGISPEALKSDFLRTALKDRIEDFSEGKVVFESVHQSECLLAFSRDALILLDELQYRLETDFPGESHQKAVFRMVDEVGALPGDQEEEPFKLAVNRVFRFVRSVGIPLTMHLWRTLPKPFFYDLIARSCNNYEFKDFQNVFRLFSSDTLADILKNPMKDFFDFDLQTGDRQKSETDSSKRIPFENLNAVAEGFKKSHRLWGRLHAWSVTMDVAHLDFGPLHLLQEGAIEIIFEDYRARWAGAQTLNHGIFFSDLPLSTVKAFCQRHPIAYFFMAIPRQSSHDTLENKVTDCLNHLIAVEKMVHSPQERMNLATLLLRGLEGFYGFLVEHHPQTALQMKAHFDRTVLRVVEMTQDNLSIAWADYRLLFQPLLRRWFCDRPCMLQTEEDKAQLIRLDFIDPDLCQIIWAKQPALRPGIESACGVFLLAHSNRIISSFSKHTIALNPAFLPLEKKLTTTNGLRPFLDPLTVKEMTAHLKRMGFETDLALVREQCEKQDWIRIETRQRIFPVLDLANTSFRGSRMVEVEEGERMEAQVFLTKAPTVAIRYGEMGGEKSSAGGEKALHIWSDRVREFFHSIDERTQGKQGKAVLDQVRHWVEIICAAHDLETLKRANVALVTAMEAVGAHFNFVIPDAFFEALDTAELAARHGLWRGAWSWIKNAPGLSYFAFRNAVDPDVALAYSIFDPPGVEGVAQRFSMTTQSELAIVRHMARMEKKKQSRYQRIQTLVSELTKNQIRGDKKTSLAQLQEELRALKTECEWHDGFAHFFYSACNVTDDTPWLHLFNLRRQNAYGQAQDAFFAMGHSIIDTIAEAIESPSPANVEKVLASGTLAFVKAELQKTSEFLETLK